MFPPQQFSIALLILAGSGFALWFGLSLGKWLWLRYQDWKRHRLHNRRWRQWEKMNSQPYRKRPKIKVRWYMESESRTTTAMDKAEVIAEQWLAEEPYMREQQLAEALRRWAKAFASWAIQYEESTLVGIEVTSDGFRLTSSSGIMKKAEPGNQSSGTGEA